MKFIPTKKQLIVGVTCIALMGTCSYIYKQQSSNPDGSSNAIEYYTVKESDLSVTVVEAGTLKAVKETVVRNHLSGSSKIIFLTPEGTSVKKGDLIVALDAAEMRESKKKLELEVETSKAAVQAAKNSLVIDQSTVDSDVRTAKKAITFAEMDLQKFNELDKQQQLRNAESDITSAEDSYKLSQQKYDWSVKLADKGFETKSQVDRDKLDLKGKLKSLETANSRFQMLKKFDLPKQEAELKSKLTEAQKKFERVVKQGDSRVIKAKSSLSSAKRKLKLNMERLEQVNEKLAKVKLTAPVDGLALYPKVNRRSRQTPVEEGANVSKNQKLIIIPDISQMKVSIKVPEFHISKVKRDQKAFITLDSVPDKKFKGQVTKVAVLPDSDNWLSTGEKFYSVEVLVTDPLPGVKPSISASVEIIIADLKNVVSVPLQAIKTDKGVHYCYVKDGLSNEKREVSIGLMNNSFIEILEGLKPEDQVLLSTPEED